jgi:hypothetical protein
VAAADLNFPSRSGANSAEGYGRLRSELLRFVDLRDVLRLERFSFRAQRTLARQEEIHEEQDGGRRHAGNEKETQERVVGFEMFFEI